MESITYQKNLKSTPKKMRMIRDLIVKMSPSEALEYLEYDTSKSARIYYKVINSAISNATNALKVGSDMLKFKLLTVEEGQKLKRYKAGSKGMAKPILRRYSHVKVILVEKVENKPSKILKKEKVVKKTLSPTKNKAKVEKKTTKAKTAEKKSKVKKVSKSK